MLVWGICKSTYRHYCQPLPNAVSSSAIAHLSFLLNLHPIDTNGEPVPPIVSPYPFCLFCESIISSLPSSNPRTTSMFLRYLSGTSPPCCWELAQGRQLSEASGAALPRAIPPSALLRLQD